MKENHLEIKNPAAEEYVFFWKVNGKNGCFSNFYRCDIVIDDVSYFCVEQYMMAQKAKMFHDEDTRAAILQADTPAKCKALGRKVTPFDSAAWSGVSYEIVKEANRAKFQQNPPLMQKLLETGDAILVEASPEDKIWGIGLNAKDAAAMAPHEWPGTNLLGKILMELREEFRDQ